MQEWPMEIRCLDPSEWQLLKAVRLQALAESPHAFSTTYEHEVDLTDGQWRAVARDFTWFVAERDGEVVAIAAGGDGIENTKQLVGFWVSPALRASGAAARLMDRVADWARAAGASELRLYVAESNSRARRFYDRYGFHATGARRAFRGNPLLSKDECSLRL